MKFLLDTNVILDIALERQPFFRESDEITSLIEQGIIEGYVSASTISDLYYIIRKDKGREAALDFLNKLVILCQVATVDRSVITMALTTNFRDFEDAIQYSTAVVNQLDIIVTRNPQDFPVFTPRILTPSLLIQELTA